MNTSAFNRAKQTVLITGGASGIGPAIARRFAAHGNTVEIRDLQSAVLDTALTGLRGESCDVSESAWVDAALKRSLTGHARLQGLVNNTVIAPVGNALLPGRIHTPFVDAFTAENDPSRESEMFEKAQPHPTHRPHGPGRRSRHRRAVSTQRGASFINGGAYLVDGGTLTLR